jgi:hypothetical protein
VKDVVGVNSPLMLTVQDFKYAGLREVVSVVVGVANNYPDG